MRKVNLLDCCIAWICSGVVYMSAVSLIVDPNREAPCNGNLSLSCNISSHKAHVNVIHMSWVSKEKGRLCEVEKGEVQSQANGTQCQYDGKKLSLTLLQAGPLSQGTYICKIRSDWGTDQGITTVIPTAVCAGSFQHTTVPAGEKCLFYGVYPKDQVYWFSSDKNLTGCSKDNKSLQDTNGLYNISSVFPKELNRVNLSCKLSNHSSRAVPVQSPPNLMPDKSFRSYSSCTGLYWALFLAGVMLSLSLSL